MAVASRVIGAVRLSLVDVKVVIEELEKEEMERDPEINKHLQIAMKRHCMPRKFVAEEVKPRSMKTVLVAFRSKERSYCYKAADQAMTLYFDEESKVWKPLQAVPDVGEEVIRWSSAEHIGNHLYLVSDSSDSHIYSYHAVTKSWEKLPKFSSSKEIHCLCSVGDYAYSNSFEHEGLDTAAAVMNSKLYVMHGFYERAYDFHFVNYKVKPAIVHCFDPTRNEWENVTSTCYPHFGSSLFVVSNKLYVAGGKRECSQHGEPLGEDAPVEVFKEKKKTSILVCWSVVEQKHIPANNLGAVEIEGRVYFIINKFPVDSRIRIQLEDTRQFNLEEWKNVTDLT
ncbi:unnamed protein product [Pocillopora meandrina]|uniref:Uncharacterized protein n=1 Tax=Pocillopora meandrina TaxID=46732 RepID=A0AAU9X769_9CNID|nr:unnamed protein product [Pocillopora meandrina]